MTPDLPPVPPGRWLPRLEAARQLGITERTLQRRMKQGLVMTRHDEHNRVQVYVSDRQDSGHAPDHDMSMTPSNLALADSIVRALGDLATEQTTRFAARNAEQEAIIRQQAEEIGQLREALRQVAEQARQLRADPATGWWRVLWQRLSGHES